MWAELFGYAEASFSGASKEGAVGAAFRALGISKWSVVRGKESLSDDYAFQGTLFLDEIGNTDEACQGVLLRFLEAPFAAAPLGHSEMKNVRPRIIAATNDLDWIRYARAGVAKGNIRPDLFDRVARHILCVPKLDPEDVYGFVRIVADEDVPWEESAIERMADIVDERLIRGNVRGLVNFVRRTELIVKEGVDIGWNFHSVTRSVVDLSLWLTHVPDELLSPQYEEVKREDLFRTPKANVAETDHVEFALQYAVSCEREDAERQKDAPGSLVANFGETRAELILLTWFAVYDECHKPHGQTLVEYRNRGAAKWFVTASENAAHRTVAKTAKTVLGVSTMKEISTKAGEFKKLCVRQGIWPPELP